MTRSPGGFCRRGLFLPVHSFVLPFLRKRTSELPDHPNLCPQNSPEHPDFVSMLRAVNTKREMSHARQFLCERSPWQRLFAPAFSRLCGRRIGGRRVGSSLAGETPPSGSAATQSGQTPETARPLLIWGNLLHLSYNMWLPYQPYLRCDDKLWEELTKRMADVGMNMVVIDLGDGVQYQSHPEIAVQGAWSAERLRKELARLAQTGLGADSEAQFLHLPRRVAGPVFSAGLHAALLQGLRRPDRRSDSSVRQAAILSLGLRRRDGGKPEEFAYAVVRQYELWWHDFEFFVKQVERRGARPWIWSDYAWRARRRVSEADAQERAAEQLVLRVDFKDTDDRVQWYGKLGAARLRSGADRLELGRTPRTSA